MTVSPTTKVSRYRDEIHGDVILDPVAVALINTAPLQRLGRIYQLGYTHLVYRGATHTRLSHVIGAYHMAGRFVDFLRENYRLMSELPPGAAKPEEFLPRRRDGEYVPEEVRWLALRYLVQWAALLHDVGHIPLGHTLEDEFEGIFVEHDSFRSPRLPALWWRIGDQPSDLYQAFINAGTSGILPPELEKVGIDAKLAFAVVMSICLYKEKRIPGPNAEQYKSFEALLNDALNSTDDKALSADQSAFVSHVREQLETVNELFAPFMVDIVADTICADYMDYVRRDTANTGLDRQTDDRVLSQFLIGEYITASAEKQYRMALLLTDKRGKPRLDACTGVVDLVRRRFRLAEIIYYHKTKVSASAMLAKALSLIGKPPEVPAEAAKLIPIADTKKYAAEIASGQLSVADLRRRHSAAALLSPEIGDESLLIWLQERAWGQMEALAAAPNQAAPKRESVSQGQGTENPEGPTAELEAILRGIGLLQLLGRRDLYKVCAQINADCIASLTGISGVDGEGIPELLQRKISDVLGLRGQNNGRHEARPKIERAMAAAAQWPPDSVLIYVPPRKSQAKGIETRALSGGSVVTLGQHPAVSGEVEGLNRQYERLWRVILLIHPEYQHDDLGLSRAIDVFLRKVWELNPGSCESQIRSIARFEYIPESQREGAALFRELSDTPKPRWAVYLSAPSTVRAEATLSPREQAFRAYLMCLDDDSSANNQMLKTRCAEPDAIERLVNQYRESTENSVHGLRDALNQTWKALTQAAAVASESTASVRGQSLSEAAFESQIRVIFRQYSPAEDKGVLRPHYRDFIAKHKKRPGLVRGAIAEKLNKYDLSDIPGVSAQFNREEDPLTAGKLREIERELGIDDQEN